MSAALESIARIRQQPGLLTLADVPMWACSGGTNDAGKPDKAPRDWRAPWRHGKSNDPATWGTLAQIEDAARRYPDLIDHVGIISGQADIRALDWDYKPHATTPQIVTTQAALFCGSYQEISLSGRGMRCLVWGEELPFKKRKIALEEGVELEVFNSHQYVILTGNTVNAEDIRDGSEELARLLAALEPEESKPAPRTPTPRSHYSGTEATPWDAACEAWNLGETLERNGYTRKAEGRYLAPTSQTGLAGVTLFRDDRGRMRCYSHHASDPLNNGHANDVFDVFTLLEHGGDYKAAARAAGALLGMERSTSKPATDTTADPAALWQSHSTDVLQHCMTLLAGGTGHQRSRGKYMDILLALHAAVSEGCLVTRQGKTLIEFGGLAVLAERMLYRGRLHDLRAGLDYLCTIGMIGRVVSTNPEDRYAPLAVEVNADPRHLPAMRFQGALKLRSTSYTTLRRLSSGTRKSTMDTTKDSQATPLCPSRKNPLHDARFVLYWIQRGAASPEGVAQMGRMRLATVRKHLAALEAEGLIVGFEPSPHAQQAIRQEIESDPAYRDARVRYLQSALSFGARGTAICARVGAPRMQARRHATLTRAHDRLTRLMDGESCAAVFGLVAA